MSPLNRGPLLGPRMPPAGMRPPPRFGRHPMPGMPLRMPPPPMPPMGGMFGPMRQRMPPPPPRPGGMMRPGPPPPPPLFGPRGRGPPPLMMPMMGPRCMGPRGPPIRPVPRGILPPQGLPHMRPRFPPGNGNMKVKSINNARKVNKLEELELKKPWMTDEIRSEIQKKNKLYAKSKKNKDAKEWEEFKDLRNKVTRMIRDAKNEYLAKHPDQAALYQDEPLYCDIRDENYTSSEEDDNYYCEICDRDFQTEKLLDDHKRIHRVCGIDGCTFSAHPKLIEKHITMQHCTGLYDRMKNIKTPEDIDNWIAERKRKYPTKSNIEMKKAETLEKKERGEIIERGKSKVQSSQQTRKPVRERKRRGKKRRIFEFKADPVEDGESQCCNGIQPFRGTYSLVEVEEDVAPVESVDNSPSGIQFSDDEDDAIPPNNSNIELNPVFSLVADYGSDSDDLPEELPIKKMKLEDPEKIESLPVPVMTPAKAKNSRKESSKMNPRKPTDEPSNSMGKPHPKRLMLLERLLSRSIQHERNYICQCIKYIADNNFFE